MEEGSDDLSTNVRGETITASKSVMACIPYFESLLSGRWKQDEGISIDANPYALKAFIAYADDKST